MEMKRIVIGGILELFDFLGGVDQWPMPMPLPILLILVWNFDNILMQREKLRKLWIELILANV